MTGRDVYATSEEGVRTRLLPHGTDGCPDYGNPDVGLGYADMVSRTKYEQRVLDKLEEWGLWQYAFTKPGEMSRRYMELRKQDPEILELSRIAKMMMNSKSRDQRAGIEVLKQQVLPQEYWDYPLPGTIFKGRGRVGTPEWLVWQEMCSVWVLFLKNTKVDPVKEMEKGKVYDMSRAAREEVSREHMIQFTLGVKNKYKVGPGSGVRFTLAEEPMVPRSMPGTQLVRYNHSDPEHNPALRGDRQYADGLAYVTPLPEPKQAEVVPPVTEEVAKDVKGKGR